MRHWLTDAVRTENRMVLGLFLWLAITLLGMLAIYCKRQICYIKGVLRVIEWRGSEHALVCPYCSGYPEGFEAPGHSKNCALWNLIK